MAVLNIQIVNASLADIQGAIGAGIDDGGWISTSYLIAEIVVIPLSGWLAQVFSIRVYLLTNAILFLVFSAVCALAQDLPQMIGLRALQGFSGGVLIPMAFTLIITLLPKAKQPVGLALFALSATFAPAIGATIGGYLTENWGLPQLVLIPLVPRLMKRFDARLVIGVGFALFAASNFMNIYMTSDYGSDQLFWPNVVRAIGQALAFAPLSAIATAGIEPENAGSASGLFNMMRNLGGAVGIAMLQTFLTKREQYHSNVLMQSVSLLEQATRSRIEALTQYFVSHGVIDRTDAAQRAVVAIGHIVQKQAFILAFSDTFYLLGAALIVALMAALPLKRPDHLEAGAAH